MNEKPFSCFAVAGLLLWLAGAPIAAQTNQPLHTDGWVLAATHAPGLKGSIWRTDLWIYLSSAGNAVTLTFCKTGQDNTSAQGYAIETVPGQHVYYFEDVVERYLHVGDAGWLGAIHYTADTDVQVWARVYSISPDGSKSYGQIVEGIPTGDMSPSYLDDDDDHKTQRVYATKHTADGRYRVNFGIVNPTAVSCSYSLAMYDETKNHPSTGSAATSLTVPPYSMVQLTDPFAAVESGGWNNHWTKLWIETAGGGGFLYASVVDNATNDAYFVRGVKDRYAEWQGGLNETLHGHGWLLAAAHTPGLQSSIWRTDLWVYMQSVTASSFFKLRFCASGKDNSQAPWIDLPLTDGTFIYHVEDVVAQFLGADVESWLGAIEYDASSGAQVWARVYSISSDGKKSYGQLVEGVPAADMSPDNDPWDYRDHQYLFAAKHTADGRFRVNVGVVNPTGVAATYALNAFDTTGPGGSPLTTVGLTVQPYSMVQLNDPLAALAGGEWSNLVLRVQCSKDGAGGFAYASVVDNATNDAYFVRGIKLLPAPSQ